MSEYAAYICESMCQYIAHAFLDFCVSVRLTFGGLRSRFTTYMFAYVSMDLHMYQFMPEIIKIFFDLNRHKKLNFKNRKTTIFGVKLQKVQTYMF